MWRQTSVQIWISNDKYITYLTIYDKSDDRKAFVATFVANVATERIRLDTTKIICDTFLANFIPPIPSPLVSFGENTQYHHHPGVCDVSGNYVSNKQ